MARAQEFKELGDESSITLLEWCYDYLLNRYGLPKHADKKFQSMLFTCQHHKSRSSRIGLFGRFLCLHDDLSNSDLRVYLDIIDAAYKLVLNFQIQDTDELPLIPTVSILLLF